jgi:hypothetical protein
MSDEIVMPKGITIENVSFTLSQNSDCCELGDNGQMLNVELHDGGAGFYYTINSKRPDTNSDRDSDK